MIKSIHKMNGKQTIAQLDIGEKAPLLTGGNFWTTRACPALGLESFMLADGPHGLRVQKKNPNHMGLGSSLPATCFPTAAAMACSWDPDLCERLGGMLGSEAAFFGVGVLLGPGLNIKRSPLCGRNFEYFSEDGYLTGKLAAAYVRGIQANGVSSCIKHFAVNSREFARLYCDSAVDMQTLRETYLTGFEIAVKEGGARAVMTAYNKVNGVYCNENPLLLNDILRGEWGFEGLVVSDWGGTHDRAAAVAAGADLEMPRCDFSTREIVEAVQGGALDESAVNRSVERLCALGERAAEIEKKPFSQEEHACFAQRCAEESIVLLKNREGALPLSPAERVAVVGDFAVSPRYQGAGSSLVCPTRLENLVAAMKGSSSLCFVGYEQGFRRFGGSSRRLLKRALKLASSADTVVVCVGLDEDSECEGADREHLSLPANQIRLLKELAALNKKVVAVLSCGSVVDTSWDVCADAVVHTSLAGQSGAGAVVKVLTGETNPSGRLAESYPHRLSDCPCSEIYAKNAYAMNFAEGVYVGYKYYNALKKEVKYPFGYGLSYTEFAYSAFSATPRGVRFTVKNVGKRAGATVAQIYVRCPRRELCDGFSELKGFRKIFLGAGEERTVEILLDEYAFRTYDMQRNCWQVGGTYTVSLGENSRDMLCECTVNITEDNYTLPKGYRFDDGQCGKAEDYNAYYSRHMAGETEKESALSEQAFLGGAAARGKRKKKRIVADYSTEVSDLKYCKGLLGKIFGLVVYRYTHAKDKLLANSMSYLPVRSLMQFMKLNAAQAEGFLIACNGRLFKGLKLMIFGK